MLQAILRARSVRILSSVSLGALVAACGSDADQGPTPTGDGGVLVGPDGAVITPGDGGVLVGPDGAVIPPGDDDSGGGGPEAGPIGDGGTQSGAGGCAPMTVTAGATVEGSKADVFAWSDGSCKPRTASLIRSDAKDAFGERGGYLRSLTYVANGVTRDIKGTGANGWQGFGYIINHYGSTASETQQIGGTYTTRLAGKHHAIHEFTWKITPGGPVSVTAHWFFATGKSNPLFSVTFDASGAGANTVNADSRSPYGDLAWDNVQGGNVSGVGWGDSYKFKTTGGDPLTKSSPWDYTQPNIVPYCVAWSTPADAEMGLVATLTWAEKIEGGDYGGGALKNKWKTSGSSLLTDIPDWEWPYQLNQYELPSETASHRVAWGTTYGAVGQSTYNAFGHTLSGYPYQSYAVYVVLGTHTHSVVDAQVAEIEETQNVTMTATRGTVATSGPGGVGRTDTVAFPRPGFDPVYGAWTADAAANAVTLRFDAGGTTLTNPVIEVRNYTAASAPSQVTLAGKPLTADTDYFATVDSATHRLWLTLNQSLTGATELTVD